MRVNLRLHGGDLVTLEDDQSSRLYEALWSLAPDQRGAVSAAGKVRHAQVSRRAELLDPHESSAVRDALTRLDPSVGG
jgi:hypothetical protein